jgi:LacI family repressor for deo operon, udp, cdd, tsx, nupC, and nupG
MDVGSQRQRSIGAMSRAKPQQKAEQHRRAVTILDVARRAGVSTATVSRAVAMPDRVAEATRSKVFAAIEETGYTPNVTARNLRARSTKIVLALVPGMSNTFFTPILNAVEDTLSEAGYGMIIGDTRNSAVKESHYTRLIRAGQVDGVILFTGHLPRDEGYTLSERQVPVALVCNEIPGDSCHSVFDVANAQAARIAVDYLIDAGHRRIAHIAGSPLNVEARERMKGYVSALSAAGIPVEDELIWGDSFRYEAGVEGAERYLAMARRPTGVFAAADDAAIGFIKTLRDAGVRTPDDVSVVGFDDIDYTSVIDPPLTTMHQPRAELGRAAAVDLLKRMARGAPDLAPTRLRLPCKLVIRESVRVITASETRTASRQGAKPETLAPPASRRAGVSQ